MRKQEKKENLILHGIKEHVNRNRKQYTIVSIFFLIGIITGVIFVNQSSLETKKQIGDYIITFLDCLKTDYQIDLGHLLKNVIGNHILFAFLLWFMGCTVIGIPVVYGLVVMKGFSLGYTISSIIFTLGIGKGIVFNIITLLLQNILIIPATLALAVSGIKLYQSIIKNKRKENIKIEIIRHTFFSFGMLIIFACASIVEVYVSSNLMNICATYF